MVNNILPTYLTLSAIYIENAPLVSLENNKIMKCGFAKQGGAILLSQTKMVEKGSEFIWNSAVQAGAICCTMNCKMYLTGTTFENNIA